MDIYVVGNGKVKQAPDLIVVRAVIKAVDYCKMGIIDRIGKNMTSAEQSCRAEATKKGVENFELFMKNIVDALDINRSEVKTQSFSVRSNTIDAASYLKDKNQSRIYVFDNCVYTQNATFSFEFDRYKLARLIELFAENAAFATCNVDFALKDEGALIDKCIVKAYECAYHQAKIIAESAGYTSIMCAGVSHQAFPNQHLLSDSSFHSEELVMHKTAKCADNQTLADKFADVFNLNDISVSKTLYYHFTTAS